MTFSLWNIYFWGKVFIFHLFFVNVRFWQVAPSFESRPDFHLEAALVTQMWDPTDLFGQVTRPVRRVDDLVVEDGEVEGEAEADGVRRLHLGARDVERVLVRLLRVLRRRWRCDIVRMTIY